MTRRRLSNARAGAARTGAGGRARGRGVTLPPAQAFTGSNAHPTYVRDGVVQTIPVDDYLARFSGSPAPDEAERERWIDAVDVVGNAAVAKVILDYPQVRLTDYMSLPKVDGEWKIIHKSFTSQPR